MANIKVKRCKYLVTYFKITVNFSGRFIEFEICLESLTLCQEGFACITEKNLF